MNYKLLLFTQCLFSFCLCQLNIEEKEKLLNGFIVYYNNLPNQIYNCDEGVLLSAQQTDENTYKIEATLKVSEIRNIDVSKLLVCSASVQDLHENGVTVLENDFKCDEQQKPDEGIVIDQPTDSQVDVTEAPIERKPIQLDNEVQSNTGLTSGEQFIAIPRERQSTPCVGCSSHVNLQAAGVSDLVNLGMRHLEKHEPAVRHNLDRVVDVERQVQVVNGVRYILTLLVKFNSCTDTETEACALTKACKISVLVKPWLKLPSGSKYRSILANNCTEEWQYGDDGEVLPDDDDNRGHNQIDSRPKDDTDEIRVLHNSETQSQPNKEKSLSDEKLKDIESQIIPKYEQQSTKTVNPDRDSTVVSPNDVIKQHVVKDESVRSYVDNSLPLSETVKPITTSDHTSTLNQDKKKAIDDMLDFFNFSGYKPSDDDNEGKPRMKRSYDQDLQVFALAENYQDIKKRLENAKFIFTLAHTMIDYINEMDITVKNRILKDVLNAEEEFENYQHFVYIQALVTIPCHNAECKSEDTNKICNGVIDSTHVNYPLILNSFCHNNQIEKIDSGKEVPPDDHVLQDLVKKAIKKIESESFSEHAIRLNKIINANTRQASGTLTKISIIIEYINCNRSVPYPLKKNCTVLSQLGTRICEVIVLERHWLKEKTFTYTCTDIPVDVSMSEEKLMDKSKTVDDPKIHEMLGDALQHLEIESNRNNKMKIVKINSITSQIVAGFFTKIEFLVGYTTCRNDDVRNQLNICKLLPNEGLRRCKAQFWDRSWIEDGRQMEVACDDTLNKVDDSIKSGSELKLKNDDTVNANKLRKKRSLDFVGGQEERNVDAPEYKALALESLQKFMTTSSTQQHYNLINIDKVTVQLVSGKLTNIDFKISPTNCEVDSNGTPTSTSCKAVNPEIKYECTSKILEQVWLDNKHISVTCHVNEERSKRNILGGFIEQNPSDPTYIRLAEESLRKYVTTSDARHSQFLKLVSVEKVTTQLVSGRITRMDFIVASHQNNDIFKCQSKIWERPWLNEKDIEVTCNAQDLNTRTKRQLGGAKEEDPNDPKYKALAEESLQKYVQSTGKSQSLKLIKVDKVTTQVVSGSLTKIYFVVAEREDGDHIKCNSKIWKQKWLNRTEIDVNCNINPRSKRQVPGGHQEQNPDDPKYLNLAKESLNKYLTDSGITKPHKIINVTKVYTQVVSGSLTYIDFEVSPENEGDVITCHSKVWEQPWLNKKQIDVNCDINARSKRQVPGGHQEQNPDDPKYLNLAKESLNKYLTDSGITKPHKIINVTKVYTQVVSGSLTYIDFEVSPENEGDVITCHSKVWEQPWLNKKQIDVNCDINARSKRQVPGGDQEQNPNDPIYLNLAKKSLDKYMADAGISSPHTVVRVIKVTTQLVSGLTTYINFKVSPLNKGYVITCASKIWEQPWLNKTEIDVQCNDNNPRIKREIIKRKRSRFGNRKVEDPNVEKFKSFAEESLRKYERILGNGVNHKLVKVKSVVSKLVSGMIYIIDFTAKPNTCSANVSESDCQDGDIIYCQSKIWSKPWLKSNEIDVSCYNYNESDEEEDFDVDVKKKDKPKLIMPKKFLGGAEAKNVRDPRYQDLAKESLNKYLTKSNRKFVHKIIQIQRVTEQVVEGTLTKLDFSVSPTKCLRTQTSAEENDCEFTKPRIVLYCTAKVWDRPWLNDKDIKVGCKQRNSKNRKLNTGEKVRAKRQVPNDEDYVDDEMSFYYANRALQHINENTRSNHLHKLITIHAVQHSMQMKTSMVRMYIEVAETFCLRHQDEMDLPNCEELDGLNHKLCLARLWPSPDDELVVRHVSVVCDDEEEFESLSGLHIGDLLLMSIKEYERKPEVKFKTVHQGEPHIIPSLDSKVPIVINFLLATTNCTKNINLTNSMFPCYLDISLPSKSCSSYIWMMPNGKAVSTLTVSCDSSSTRTKRSAPDVTNTTTDDAQIQKLVAATLEKLEMQSIHRYKQRLLQINSHSTKITSGKVTTIDFDVGYTSCLKYEWVENVTSCDFLEHLPRRHCVAQIWERLWVNNGRNIDVNCEDDETPLETHIEFESAEMAMELAKAALKHIEAKYPHPRKQKVVRIFSLEKQVVAGIHYRMKIEVGLTDCVALSEKEDCNLAEGLGLNKFCRVNVWVRPWTDHPPNYRVSCDYQDGATTELYRNIQAEHLFFEFITTYNPYYTNDHNEMRKRFDIFKANVRKIHELNIYERGTARYGVTRFADLTYEEFQAKNTGLKPSLKSPNQIPMRHADIPDITIPESFDWREYDMVTEVKDQGSCGSCWAFSVTGNIEGQWKMQSGKLVSLSEQELVDCDKLDQGCNGGLPDNAYRAIEEMGGLESETDYPYEGEDDKCAFNKTLSMVQISGAVNISSNETNMATWLLHNGPISIGINANAMQFYMGGISHPWKMLCNPTNLDHGVLIVGFGVKDYPLFNKRLPFWIVKNSWGKSWGEQGYYRVYRGDGTCGVNQMASSAVI